MRRVGVDWKSQSILLYENVCMWIRRLEDWILVCCITYLGFAYYTFLHSSSSICQSSSSETNAGVSFVIQVRASVFKLPMAQKLSFLIKALILIQRAYMQSVTLSRVPVPN